ncbi:MAG: alpha/beta fold hydrolase [Rhodocyclaceae bacterium]|nr:alpha/beta fold hydrolase [Rhodocyclaceae bacterium]
MHDEAVLLVHGLWMNGSVMAWLARRIAAAGYATRSPGYHSVGEALDSAARRIAVAAAALPQSTLHVVGHSLGGLVLLRADQLGLLSRPGRRVLIASPVAASAAARALAARRWSQPLLGRCLADWLALPPCGAPRDRDYGLIAGSRPLGMGSLITQLERPHDGAVALSETRLAGARDHIVLPSTHSGLLLSATAAAETLHFLRNGCFEAGTRRA